MTRVSEIAEHWFGLCWKAPAMRTAPATLVVQPDTIHPSPPNDGGPDRIRHGISIAVSSTKTLIHNRQLLWFSFFTALVLAGHLITQWVLFYVWEKGGEHILLGSPVVTFMIELPTVFCLIFLLAGLVLSISSENGGPASFFHGLRRAKEYSRLLAGWSVVVALAGTLLFIAGLNLDGLSITWYRPFDNAMWFMPFNIFGTLWAFVSTVLDRFPFSWALDLFTYIRFHSVGWIIRLDTTFHDAFVYTLILSAINVLLFVLTLFAVPLLVLERKRVKEAVFGSFTLMKKIWAEVAACILGLGIVVLAVSLTFLLFQFSGVDQVSAVTGQMDISSSSPSEAWIAVGILYVLALSIFAFIMATIGGIAALGLYRYAKIRDGQE
jgi:hypothetical protein